VARSARRSIPSMCRLRHHPPTSIGLRAGESRCASSWEPRPVTRSRTLSAKPRNLQGARFFDSVPDSAPESNWGKDRIVSNTLSENTPLARGALCWSSSAPNTHAYAGRRRSFRPKPRSAGLRSTRLTSQTGVPNQYFVGRNPSSVLLVTTTFVRLSNHRTTHPAM
jgi:hypothetical protein